MYYLGVDGGGTKTSFVIINEEGKIVSHETKGTCHYVQVGFDKFQKLLMAGISDACKKAGIKISELSFSFFGLPGYGEINDDVPVLEKLVSNILQSNRFKCGNDVEAGWAGSLACQPGINLVGGTGAIGFGKDQDGNSARTSGWGYYCGDEGSAHWIGKKVISLFGKEADGRLEKTPIYDIVRNEFNITRDFDLITVVYDQLKMERDKIAKFALLLYKAAEQDDPKAIEIFRETAYEHSLTLKALIKKLKFADNQEILVSYSGGVFKSGEYVLKPLKEYILTNNIKLIKPVLEPVTGASLYALEFDKKVISKEIVEKLKNEEEMILK